MIKIFYLNTFRFQFAQRSSYQLVVKNACDIWCYFFISFCSSYCSKVILISSLIRESEINALFGLIFVLTNSWRFRGFRKLRDSLYHSTTLERSCKRISLHKQQHRHIFYIIHSLFSLTEEPEIVNAQTARGL